MSTSLSRFRTTLRDVILRMLDVYTSSQQPQQQEHELVPHSLVAPVKGVNTTSSATTSASASQLTSLLQQRSFTLHFLSQLRSILPPLIDEYLREDGGSDTTAVEENNDEENDADVAVVQQKVKHVSNELYTMLSQEAEMILREVIASRGATSYHPQQVYQSAHLSTSTTTYTPLLHTKTGTLASYAEQHDNHALAEYHHLNRLCVLGKWFDDDTHQQHHMNYQQQPAFHLIDFIRTWYEYGCFLLRSYSKQQQQQQQTSDSTDDSTVADSSLDLACTCFRQCLKYDSHYLPALVLLSCAMLESDDVEGSEKYVRKCEEVWKRQQMFQMPPSQQQQNTSSSPLQHHHPLLLALKSFYHDLAEEDTESQETLKQARLLMQVLLDTTNDGSANSLSSSGTDSFLYTLLSTHIPGAHSLPLYYSQSIELIQARFFKSIGCVRLWKAVVEKMVDEREGRSNVKQSGSMMNRSGSSTSLLKEDRDRLMSPRAQNVLSPSSSSSSTTSTNSVATITRYDYYEYGCYLELASWHAENLSLQEYSFDSYIQPHIDQVIKITNSKPLVQHNRNALAYTYGVLAEIYWKNKDLVKAKVWAEKDVGMMEEMNNSSSSSNMSSLSTPTITHDPHILSLLSSLYLLQHNLTSSLKISHLLLSTSPLHSSNPYIWLTYSEALSRRGGSLSSYQQAEEALSRVLSLDEKLSAAWAGLTCNTLRRKEWEMRQVGKYSKFSRNNEDLKESSEDYTEPLFTFHRSIYSSVPCSDVSSLMELGRLWWKHGKMKEAEMSFVRAGIAAASDGSDVSESQKEEISKQLTRLLAASTGGAGGRARHATDALLQKENHAAVRIQSVMKGALTRKQMQVKEKKGRKKQEKDVPEATVEEVQTQEQAPTQQNSKSPASINGVQEEKEQLQESAY